MLVLAMSLSLFLRKKTNILSILLTLCYTNALEREGQARLKQEDGSIFGGWAWGSRLVSQPGCRGQSLTGPGTLSHLQVALGSRGCPARPQGLSPTREAALVTQLVPTRVAPRQQGVNLLSVGKASRTLLPASQFAQGRALQKLKPAGRQAPPALVGSCPGLPSMGRPGRAVGGAECAACAGPATWRPGSLPPPKTHPRPSPGTCCAPGSTWVHRPLPRGGWNPGPSLTTSETLSTPLNL